MIGKTRPANYFPKNSSGKPPKAQQVNGGVVTTLRRARILSPLGLPTDVVLSQPVPNSGVAGFSCHLLIRAVPTVDGPVYERTSIRSMLCR